MTGNLSLCAATLLAIYLSTSPAATAPTCNSHREFPGVDLSQPVTTIKTASGKSGLEALHAIGVKTIARYYDWLDEETTCKSLFPKESDAIIKAGFSIITIFQHENSDPETFLNKNRGARDAMAFAAANGQPAGSAIYFAVDGVDQTIKDAAFEWRVSNGATVTPSRRKRLLRADASFRKHIKFYERFRSYHRNAFRKDAALVVAADIIPFVDKYFTELNRVMKADGRYRVGAYGSGLVCKHLLDKKLADFCWLAMSTGWPQSREFQSSGRWSLVQQHTTFCKGWKFNDREMVRFDFNRVKTGDVGQWNRKGKISPAAALSARCKPSW
jgi:hypothetical protein